MGIIQPSSWAKLSSSTTHLNRVGAAGSGASYLVVCSVRLYVGLPGYFVGPASRAASAQVSEALMRIERALTPDVEELA